MGILAVLAWAVNPWLLALLVVLAGGAFNAPLVPGTALFSRGTEKAGLDQAVAFRHNQLRLGLGLRRRLPLGRVPRRPRGDALSYFFLMGVCMLTLLLVRGG
jgi:hypothetical protein